MNQVKTFIHEVENVPLELEEAKGKEEEEKEVKKQKTAKKKKKEEKKEFNSSYEGEFRNGL